MDFFSSWLRFSMCGIFKGFLGYMGVSERYIFFKVFIGVGR